MKHRVYEVNEALSACQWAGDCLETSWLHRRNRLCWM